MSNVGECNIKLCEMSKANFFIILNGITDTRFLLINNTHNWIKGAIQYIPINDTEMF